MSEPAPHRIERTELVWPGKYDEQGAPVEPPRLHLPFQVLESFASGATTARPSGATARAGAAAPRTSPATAWKNRLIWGENLWCLASLVDELAGQVDLIYIDPPFLAGRDFTHSPGEGLRTQAYYDTWGGGQDAYLTMMWPRLQLARELLSERGSLYFHIGPNVNHYVRALLDEIFGAGGTEIIWKRTTAHSDSKAYGTVHDKILFYTRTARAIWNEQFVPHDPKYVEDKYTGRDPDGRRYMLDNITSPNPRPHMTYLWKGHAPPAMGWRYSQQKMAELDAQGRLWYPDSKHKRPRLKRYLDESRGVPLSTIWTDIRPINSQAKEDTAYDTQKPEALLERIIAASSEPGSLVLDFFCGAGTTLAVAERLGRRWIGCDLGRQAVQTSRKRLLESGAREFEILSLGSHERRYWQLATFGAPATETAYIRFILDLYGAQVVEGRHLHGRKGHALVRVGAIDSPVTNAQVEAAVAEATERGVQEVHVLGWDWDLRLRHRADVRFLSIPREVMQRRAVERGDIRFFGLARVELEVVATGPVGTAPGGIRLHLRNFVLPPAEPLLANTRKCLEWSDSIDGWAVDWDFRGDAFTSRWQAYRTRQHRELKLETPMQTYAAPGVHEILVKVTDLFGNDTHHLVCWEAK